MRRRQFIALLGATVACPPMPTRAEQKLPTIGFLGAASPTAWRKRVAALVQRLRELGWIEGRTVNIEFRWAEGHADRHTEIAQEFANIKVEVIVTSGGAVRAVQAVTSTIPIVFGVANNPVEAGLVASLARPGANTTGLSSEQPDLVGKRIELLREIKPGLTRLAILSDAGYLASKQEMTEAESIAQKVGFEVVNLSVRRGDDIIPAFHSNSSIDALYVSANPLMATQMMRIATLAEYLRLPSISGEIEYATNGGMLGYGANISDLFRRSAEIVDKILRGAKPADIPVEQPTKFDLVVNLKTARALGLEVPPTLLARADEVIE